MIEVNTPEQQGIGIYPATALLDVDLLDQTLQSTIRHPLDGTVFQDEIDGIKEHVQASMYGVGDRYYAIAGTSGGVVLGVMGLSPVDEAMKPFVKTDRPIELVNACVSEHARGLGIGWQLVNNLEQVAKSRGHTEVILNSGPRYMRRGWPFWTKLYGEPVGELTDFYGPDLHAKVWRSNLV